ncbi:MAG: hypothetical protein BRC24_02050 [Parcubacteria group bacterium SW_4_46_8]|nr:MAG: hypothetical protein BRC24_02050 [Parcubacteria group bacterium SW_4_46_8]
MTSLWDALLQGVLMSFGFFLGIFIMGGLIVGTFIYLIKRRKRKRARNDFSKELLEDYASKLKNQEKYEELQTIKEFTDRMEKGKDVKEEFFEDYTIERDVDINLEGDSFSIDTEKTITKKDS